MDKLSKVSGKNGHLILSKMSKFSIYIVVFRAG